MLRGGLDAWAAAGLPVARGGAAGRSGAALYGAHCATCHQPNGKGMPGSYPALAGNAVITMRDPRAAILVTLEGLDPDAPGTKVRRKPRMPSFGHLSDEEIAAILTHARSQWGNAAGPVSPAQVKAMRAQR